MPRSTSIPQRLVAVGLLVIGLYVFAVAVLAAAPAVLMLWKEWYEWMWPEPGDSQSTSRTIASIAAVALYFMTTALSGVCALFAAGGLWWGGSRFWARLFAITGAVGSFGQAIPGLALSGAVAWHFSEGPTAVIGALWSSLPSLLFVGLAVGTLIVLGGPREGIEQEKA